MASKAKLKIIPLGGVAEIGKNMTAIEYGKDIIVIDCGSTFPSEEMLGIDLVIPDTTYLEKNAERIRAFVITHGHEDHIGALPYVLPKLNVPIYGSKLTLALIDYKLSEHRFTGAKLNCVSAGDTIRIGCFSVEFIRVGHSIAGALALAITTPIGVVMHTGDFKVDYTPIGDEPIDLARFATYGQKGVLALLSDSTNVERPGYTMSERMVGETFEKYFDSVSGRIIVATFASNIHRLQQVVDIAIRHSRKVCFSGRSMIKLSNMAMDLGYMSVPEDMLIDVEKLDKIDDSHICILTTGSQGEPMSGLVRMANSAHKVAIKDGDTVIISASPIPGNEKTVARVINQLFKIGANVVYEAMADVHVSGHARQEELKLMLSLTAPKYFIPVHGEYRHLYRHARIAKSMGTPSENVFICETGNIVEITKAEGKINGFAASGSIMVDGLGIGDIGNVVLKDRKILSSDGLFLVIVPLNKGSNTLATNPEVISRGFVYMRESEELIEGAIGVVIDQLGKFDDDSVADWATLKTCIKNALKDYLYDRTKRTPMILPIIIEI